VFALTIDRSMSGGGGGLLPFPFAYGGRPERREGARKGGRRMDGRGLMPAAAHSFLLLLRPTKDGWMDGWMSEERCFLPCLPAAPMCGRQGPPSSPPSYIREFHSGEDGRTQPTQTVVLWGGRPPPPSRLSFCWMVTTNRLSFC